MGCREMNSRDGVFFRTVAIVVLGRGGGGSSASSRLGKKSWEPKKSASVHESGWGGASTRVRGRNLEEGEDNNTINIRQKKKNEGLEKKIRSREQAKHEHRNNKNIR